MVFSLLVLVMSSAIHEYMHGWTANELGDPTAKKAGRLTLNPLVHLDPIGSFLLPALMYFGTGGAFVFGYAAPVPYNPFNLRDKRYGPAKVAASGPLANLVVAVLCGLVIRLYPGAEGSFLMLLSVVVQINLILAVFNLIPIPPLDGSKVLSAFLPANMQAGYESVQKYGMFLALALVIFAFPVILAIVNFLFRLVIGF